MILRVIHLCNLVDGNHIKTIFILEQCSQNTLSLIFHSKCGYSILASKTLIESEWLGGNDEEEKKAIDI